MKKKTGRWTPLIAIPAILLILEIVIGLGPTMQQSTSSIITSSSSSTLTSSSTSTCITTGYSVSCTTGGGGGGGGGGGTTQTQVTKTATVAAGNGTVTQAWLNQAFVTWAPPSNSTVGFSAILESAGYNNAFSETNASIFQDLTMVESTGAVCIRVDIGYDAWLLSNTTAQTQMTQIVNKIKADGKCLIIADAGAESYRGGGRLTWASFRTKWIARDGDLAGLYKPTFYEVIKEPKWYNGMILVPSTTASEWDTLTVNLINAVQANSSGTLIGVAMPGNELNVNWEENWLTNASSLSGMHFLGVDNYGTNDYNRPIVFFNANTTTKQIWVTETGSTVGYPQNTSSQPAFDQYWIQVVYYYALYLGATNIIPFWTNTWASYINPVPSFSTRTPWFTTFRTLATSYGAAVT